MIGVEDNGNISGIRSDEELFMIENAAAKHCVPEVAFTSKKWRVGEKRVLEINIPESSVAPHKAPDHNGKLKAYVRINDRNMLANGIQMKIWQKLNANNDINFVYSDDAKALLDMLKQHSTLSLKEIIPSLTLSGFKVENMLAELIIMKIINMAVDETGAMFSLRNPMEA